MGLCLDPNCPNCKPFRTSENQAATEAAFGPGIEEAYIYRGRPCVPPPEKVLYVWRDKPLLEVRNGVWMHGIGPADKPSPLKPNVSTGNRKQRRAAQAKRRKG